jgi:hypothetical protein
VYYSNNTVGGFQCACRWKPTAPILLAGHWRSRSRTSEGFRATSEHEDDSGERTSSRIMVAPARHAEQVWESQHDVCRWPTMAIRDPLGSRRSPGSTGYPRTDSRARPSSSWYTSGSRTEPRPAMNWTDPPPKPTLYMNEGPTLGKEP